MATASKLVLSNDLGIFFKGEVCNAQQRLHIALSPAVEHYVVNLLCDYSHRDAGRDTLDHEPLALLLQRAQSAPLSDRAAMLKQLGDRALYVAGFFAESIERSLVDIDYYVAMGKAAYNSVSGLSQIRRRAELTQTFDQLAQRFSRLVDVLNHVAAVAQGRSGRDTDLLKLYDRYARTKNERTRQILEDRGLSVRPQAGKESLH